MRDGPQCAVATRDYAWTRADRGVSTSGRSAGARRAADHGFRSVLVADIGVLSVFGRMRGEGLLPPDMQAKVSVMLPAANPATARLLAEGGATVPVLTSENHDDPNALARNKHLRQRYGGRLRRVGGRGGTPRRGGGGWERSRPPTPRRGWAGSPDSAASGRR